MTTTKSRALQLLPAALFLPLIAAPLNAQDWAKARLEKSPRHHEYVKVEHGRRAVNRFVVYPEVKDKAPAVVVIHEIFGLGDWAKVLADELAGQATSSSRPTCSRGMGPNGGGTERFPGRDGVTNAVPDLTPKQVTADLDAVAEYGTKLPAVQRQGRRRAASAGAAASPSASRRTARGSRPPSSSTAAGRPPRPPSSITAPVYGFYGGNDARVNATVPPSGADEGRRQDV